MKNTKEIKRLENIVARYKDSHDRFDWETGMYANLEWKACEVQGKKLITKMLGNISTIMASQIFYLFAEKEQYFPLPAKNPLGEKFEGEFKNALTKLGVNFKVVKYTGGTSYIVS